MVWFLAAVVVCAATGFVGAACVVMTGAVVWTAPRRGGWLRMALLLVLMFALAVRGRVAGEARVADADAWASSLSSRPTSFSGYVCGFPRTGRFGASFPLRTRVGRRDVIIEVLSARYDIDFGDSVRVETKGSDRRPHGEAVAVVRARTRDTHVLRGHGGDFVRRRILWPVHKEARCRLSRAMGEDAGLPAALLLGERSLLSAQTRDSFRALGVSHLLALSGMHVAIVSLVLLGVARLFGAGKFWIPVTGLSVFVAVAGDIESMHRAWIMAVLVFAARAIGRLVPLHRVLGTALAVMLAADPLAFFSVGFQLSFAATAAVLIAVSVVRRTMPVRGRRLRAIPAALAISLFVQVAVLPLQLHYFGEVSPTAAPATVLLSPLVGITLVGAALVAVCPDGVPRRSAAWALGQFTGLVESACRAAARRVEKRMLRVAELKFLVPSADADAIVRHAGYVEARVGSTTLSNGRARFRSGHQFQSHRRE